MSTKYKPNWIPLVAAGLLYLVLLSTWMLFGLSARFYTGANEGDTARVAVFNVTESSFMQKSFAVVMKPGQTDNKTITVQVQNSSETAVSFTIAFLLDGNLPITVEPPTGLTEDTGSTTTWHTTAALAGSETSSYDFYLKWDSNKNSYQYAEGIESVTVEVTAVQED